MPNVTKAADLTDHDRPVFRMLQAVLLKSTLFSNLPNEVMLRIFDHGASDCRSFATALCLTSSWTRRRALPHLLRSVELSTDAGIKSFVIHVVIGRRIDAALGTPLPLFVRDLMISVDTELEILDIGRRMCRDLVTIIACCSRCNNIVLSMDSFMVLMDHELNPSLQDGILASLTLADRNVTLTISDTSAASDPENLLITLQRHLESPFFPSSLLTMISRLRLMIRDASLNDENEEFDVEQEIMSAFPVLKHVALDASQASAGTAKHFFRTCGRPARLNGPLPASVERVIFVLSPVTDTDTLVSLKAQWDLQHLNQDPNDPALKQPVYALAVGDGMPFSESWTEDSARPSVWERASESMFLDMTNMIA